MNLRRNHPGRITDVHAKIRPSSAVCDETCGCLSPCSGGVACRCATGVDTTSEADGHKWCSCGEHCGCNPCSSCSGDTAAAGTGKAFCK